MNSAISEIYGNKVRVRVCGLYYNKAGDVLLVNHKHITSNNFWALPGGGVAFGESLHDALKRELKEETGVDAVIGDFLFGCEYINSPLHAIELYFEVTEIKEEVKKGYDPEIDIIADVAFFNETELKRIPDSQLHGIFRIAKNIDQLRKLSGFYRI